MVIMDGMNRVVVIGGGKGEDRDLGGGGDKTMQMQCTDHPYKNTSSPGGICAFCLQDKLGKLLLSSSSSSSTFNTSFFPTTSSSSSSSPSTNTLSLSAIHQQQHYPASSSSSSSIRAQIPFGFGFSQKKKKDQIFHHHNSSALLNRSKSTATPRRGRFLDEEDGYDCGPTQKRSDSGGNGNWGFWSFIYLLNSSSSSKPSSTALKSNNNKKKKNPNSRNCIDGNKEKKKVVFLECTEESCEIPPQNNNAASASFSLDRKVCRSRSVGCGSRSFSGDFFDRISTGFADCTLRRVESHREGKPLPKKVVNGQHPHNCMKERVKCGGIFGRFNLTSSSSSSSSSSYWVSTSVEEEVNERSTPSMVRGRSRSWGWALASPLRAFNKQSSKEGKRREMSVIGEASSSSRNNINNTPNLAAIPSLLAVGS